MAKRWENQTTEKSLEQVKGCLCLKEENHSLQNWKSLFFCLIIGIIRPVVSASAQT
jgi:hypothetical protein